MYKNSWHFSPEKFIQFPKTSSSTQILKCMEYCKNLFNYLLLLNGGIYFCNKNSLHCSMLQLISCIRILVTFYSIENKISASMLLKRFFRVKDSVSSFFLLIREKLTYIFLIGQKSKYMCSYNQSNKLWSRWNLLCILQNLDCDFSVRSHLLLSLNYSFLEKWNIIIVTSKKTYLVHWNIVKHKEQFLLCKFLSFQTNVFVLYYC